MSQNITHTRDGLSFQDLSVKIITKPYKHNSKNNHTMSLAGVLKFKKKKGFKLIKLQGSKPLCLYQKKLPNPLSLYPAMHNKLRP